MTDEDTHLNEVSAVPQRSACRACALLMAGIVSMTVVAVGHRTGELDRFRAWIAEVPELGVLAQNPAKPQDRSF